MGCGGSKGAKDDAKKADNAAATSNGKTDGGKDDKMDFVKNVALFKRLPPDVLPKLAGAMETKTYVAHDVIIKQGDEGNEFFLIKEGKASVEIDSNTVAKLKAGDYFGENALLREEPRTATIKAEVGVVCYCITRAKFLELGLNEKLEFAKRGAVAGGGDKEVKIEAPSPQTDEETKNIKEAIARNKNLEFMHLGDEMLKALAQRAWKKEVASGTKIITQGDDVEVHYFYVVQEGTFEITVADESGSAAAKMQALGKVEKGGSFGELALLYFAPRAATITCTANAVVWVIARPHFKEIVAKASQANVEEYAGYLGNVDIMKKLDAATKAKVAKAMDEMTFAKNDVIFKKGDKGDLLYVLVEGQVQISVDDKVVAEPVADKKKAPFFGEKALESNEPRAATIKVLSESCRCLTLDKVSFDMLLGKTEENKEEKKRFGVIRRKDLKRIGLLGCGGFGAVELVEHVTTADTYALKALSKGYVVKSGMQNSVISEKNVQLMCDSQFVVKLFETFNGEQSLYLLLELALGGELYATYNKKGLWGKVPNAKFYVAGTVYAFEHLHSKKIIFRDLKPENLLLTEEGKVKLTDMGLAKVVVGKTFTTCGTPDYFAPELIASKGHTKAVDWWTLGVLCFELLGGHPPFESATPMQIYQKVNKGIQKVNFPKACKGPPESLIKGLCHSNPTERLPMKKGDTQNVKDHAWYQGFDWDAMFKLTMEVPYKPAVKNKKDLANFSAKKEDMPPQLNFVPDPKNPWDKDFATSS